MPSTIFQHQRQPLGHCLGFESELEVLLIGRNLVGFVIPRNPEPVAYETVSLLDETVDFLLIPRRERRE